MANPTASKVKKRNRSNESPGNISASESDHSRKKVRWDAGDSGEQDGEQTVSGDPEEQEDSLESITEKGYAAATCHGSRVAAAYYNPTTFTIQVLEDTEENAHYDLTNMFLEHARPDVILTSWKADDAFIEALREYASTNDVTFAVRMAREFAAIKGRNRLLSLGLFADVPSLDGDTEADTLPADEGASSLSGTSGLADAYDFMRRRRATTEGGQDPTLARWYARLRLSNYTAADTAPLCIACIGALLDYIVRERAFGELQDEGIGGIDVRAIESVTLEQVMHLNADALHSLQVFDAEGHASIHSDKTKEGLSLFGILDTTSTSLGRSLLRTWLTRPSCSLSTIAARHAAVALFVRPENAVPADALRSNLKGLRHLPRCMARIKAGKAHVGEWQGLVKLAFHGAMLYESLRELQGVSNVAIVQELFAALDVEQFKDIGASVNETIDWEESLSAARICVRPHVDEKLDTLKHTYNGIDSVLSSVAEQLWAFMPEDYVPSLNVVYFPQLGFLVCVPYLEEWKTDAGINVLEGWTFQFSSEWVAIFLLESLPDGTISISANVYFKSPQMHDLDKFVGDLHSNIVDQEIEIVQSLAEHVLPVEKVITATADACAELDVLLAFAAASRAFDYKQPHMVEQDVIHIVGGRHPLQEQVVDTFVPNDLILGEGGGAEGSRVVICTGANACGKSVYLKQAALIQIMAQAGCFVPAERAQLGIADKIFTRIQTRESVSRAQSAFMIDLNQVSFALRNATPRSLLLLDEFGKGTLASDGAGLFTGVIKHLIDREDNCPKVLAATHFHQVFTEGRGMLDPDETPAMFLHMQVLLNPGRGISLESGTALSSEPSGEREDEQDGTLDQDRLTYLYRVAPGIANESHAARCAEMYGVPQRVVQRAEYVSGLIQRHDVAKLLDEAMSEEEQRDLADAEEVCRRFLAVDLTSDEGKTEVLSTDMKEMLAQVLQSR